MNRYDIQKSINHSPTPSLTLTPTKPTYKLAIPSTVQTDSLKIEITEPFDPQPQIRANELTFKRKLSTSSLKNPFSEDYLQSNNTEHVPLNASLMSPAAFENALDSPSVMEIPTERHHDLIFTTYNNYKEYSKPAETTFCEIETPLTTEPDNKSFTIPLSPRKNLNCSLTESNSNMPEKEKKASASSHKKTPVKTGSHSKNKKKHYERKLEEILQREKENRDMSAQSEEQDCPMTPTLGARPFRFSSTSQRKKSRGTSSRKGDRDTSIYLKDEAKESVEKIKMLTEEAEKEREYLKVHVSQLKVMIKKENEEIGRIEKSVKIMDYDMGVLSNKQKQTGKQGIDLKDQVQKTKDAVLRLLEEIDTSRKGMEVIVEKIKGEKEEIESLKDKTNTLRRWLADGIKERETQKGLGLHIKKNKQRVAATHEVLEREKQTYVRTLEDTLIENSEDKKERAERGM